LSFLDSVSWRCHLLRSRTKPAAARDQILLRPLFTNNAPGQAVNAGIPQPMPLRKFASCRTFAKRHLCWQTWPARFSADPGNAHTPRGKCRELATRCLTRRRSQTNTPRQCVASGCWEILLSKIRNIRHTFKKVFVEKQQPFCAEYKRCSVTSAADKRQGSGPARRKTVVRLRKLQWVKRAVVLGGKCDQATVSKTLRSCSLWANSLCNAKGSVSTNHFGEENKAPVNLVECLDSRQRFATRLLY